MRICVIGKYPPIQGGVSARTYWAAHGLAKRGHEVHVVTNAKEACPPFRIHMRRQDWVRCNAEYDTGGSVTVHWTDPVDNSQFYIPLTSAFVSKLAGTAARVHAEKPFDVIYSHYLEPYGIAGHLTAEIAGVPHVVRLAGSDAGRLWRHPQLEALYDHVLRSAAILISTGVVAGRAIKHGVRPQRIIPVGGIDLPENLFSPEGPALDLAALRREVELDEPELAGEFWGGFAGEVPYFGIYGKLGETKGSFALLAAMQRLKQWGLAVGLVAMGHGWPALEAKFRSRAEELGIADRVLQIPFLPHWRVPEFLRSCLAVCCLEQDFPIIFHAPVIAREVLTCGSCLIGSTEVIRKLPDHERLPDRYGCVAIEDVQDIDALAARLAAIVRDPAPVAAVAARGRAFSQAAHVDAYAPDRLEQVLMAAARRRALPKRLRTAGEEAAPPEDPRFPITELAAHELNIGLPREGQPIDLVQARAVLAAAQAAAPNGNASMISVACAIRLEIAIAEAEETALEKAGNGGDPLFRLQTKRWAIADGDLATLIPVPDPRLRVLTFDVASLADAQGKPDIKAGPRLRHVVAFVQLAEQRREPLFISKETARILELCDGGRTAAEIAAEIMPRRRGAEKRLRQIEELFLSGLLQLHDNLDHRAGAGQPKLLASV